MYYERDNCIVKRRTKLLQNFNSITQNLMIIKDNFLKMFLNDRFCAFSVALNIFVKSRRCLFVAVVPLFVL